MICKEKKVIIILLFFQQFFCFLPNIPKALCLISVCPVLIKVLLRFLCKFYNLEQCFTPVFCTIISQWLSSARMTEILAALFKKQEVLLNKIQRLVFCLNITFRFPKEGNGLRRGMWVTVSHFTRRKVYIIKRSFSETPSRSTQLTSASY